MLKLISATTAVGCCSPRGGFAALLLQESISLWKSTRKRVAPMNILEVLALLGFGLACVKFGYELGKNAKK